MRKRILVVVAIAVAAAGLTIRYRLAHSADPPSDFAQVWAAARAWRHGGDPYAVVGPGKAFEWPFPLLYPMTAVVFALPFSLLPLRIADACFVALGAGLLAWVLTRDRLTNPALVGFGSMAYIYVTQTVQWSPLITAAALVPACAPLWVCKPTLGAAMIAAHPSRRLLWAGFAFAAIATALHPSWLRDWWHATAEAPHIRPLIFQTAAAPLVLLALVKWRRADARLLIALACVPQTPLLYETIPLFLIPSTLVEALALNALILVAGTAWQASGPYASYNATMAASAKWIVWCIYLPLTALVMTRPNEASASAASPLRRDKTGVAQPLVAADAVEALGVP